MKRLLICFLGATLIHSANAQLFSSESLGGAALGGIAGAIIGNQHHGRSGEGAAIGAGIGYVLGSVAHHQRQHRYQDESYGGSGSTYYPYYGNSYYGRSPYTYRNGYHTRRPNYAVGGAVLGGITGAVIGNQHHGQSGEGAAIGAAAGLLLGGLAEHHARNREREAYVRSTLPRMYGPLTTTTSQPTDSTHTTRNPSSSTQGQTQPRPAPVSPMKGANRLFGR